MNCETARDVSCNLKRGACCGMLVVAQLATACSHQDRTDRVNQDQQVAPSLTGSLVVDVKEHNFFRPGDGRPKDAFVLSFARDRHVCEVFLAAMNEPRSFASDYQADDFNWNANDVFLGSRLSVVWTTTHMKALRHATIDIDNNGVEDDVFHQTSTLTGADFDLLYYHPAEASGSKDIGATFEMVFNAEPASGGAGNPYEIELRDRTIDGGNAALPLESSAWAFGQFKNVVRVIDKFYVAAGGNAQRLLGHDWFPVRLLQVERHDKLRLICELLPKYRQASN